MSNKPAIIEVQERDCDKCNFLKGGAIHRPGGLRLCKKHKEKKMSNNESRIASFLKDIGMKSSPMGAEIESTWADELYKKDQELKTAHESGYQRGVEAERAEIRKELKKRVTKPHDPADTEYIDWVDVEDVLDQLSNKQPIERKRELDGKYAHENMDLLCVCGHKLGDHLAEKPRWCGTVGDTEGCTCKNFKKQPTAKTKEVGCNHQICKDNPDLSCGKVIETKE